MKSEIALLTGLLAAGGPALAQPPLVEARVETIAPGTPLEATLAQAARSRDVLWLGWTVPAVAGHGDACCFEGRSFDWSRRGCRLEGKGGFSLTTNDARGSLRSELVVLVRYVDGVPDELRPVSTTCPLSFGGRRLWWLGPVDPEASATRLAIWARSRTLDRDGSEPLLSLSMQHHGIPHLVRLAKDRAVDDRVRRQAVFWLAHSEDERAMEFLEAVLLRPAAR